MSGSLEKNLRFDNTRVTAVELDLEKHAKVQIEQIFEVQSNHGYGSAFTSDWTEKTSFDYQSPSEHIFGRAEDAKGLKNSTPFLPGTYPGYQRQFGTAPWNCADPGRFVPPQTGDSWQRCHGLVEKYDNDMCDAWKEEVDKLLIFAGLFSATVTAFSIESYKWLSEDPNDVAVRLLGFLVTQQLQSIASKSNSSSLLPSSVPSNLLLQPFTVTASSVRINVAWFLSLVLALSTVFIGILCLQWLREYQRDAALPHKEAVALRQMRYEGLLYWKVPQILSMLPVLLQASLLLFFAGLLDLLWSLGHFFVAGSVSIAVGLVMLFLGVTTALPALQHAFAKDRHLRIPQCPYKSPQSWLFYCAGHLAFWLVTFFEVPWSELDAPRFHRLLKSAGDMDWLKFDLRWRQFRDAERVVRGAPKGHANTDFLQPSSVQASYLPGTNTDLVHGLQWLNTNFMQSVEEAIVPIYYSLVELDVSTAAEIVSGLYLSRGQIEVATMRVMLDDCFSPLEEQKRDVIAAYYLHLHLDTSQASSYPYPARSKPLPSGGWHASLKKAYVEKVLRILNSQEVPQPFYDWLSEILQEVAGSLSLGLLAFQPLPPLRGSLSRSALATNSSRDDLSAGITSPEMIVQIILCVKHLLPRKYGLQTHDVAITLRLIRWLLSPIIYQAYDSARLKRSKKRRSGASTAPSEVLVSQQGQTAEAAQRADVVSESGHHLRLACALFEEIELWVGRGKEVERLERVRVVVEGLLAVFLSPSEAGRGAANASSDVGGCADLDLDWLESLCTTSTASPAILNGAGDGGESSVDVFDPEHVSPLSKANSLIHTLQAHMSSRGGLGTVFNSEKTTLAANLLHGRAQTSSQWWHLPADDLSQGTAFSTQDWVSLVHTFDAHFTSRERELVAGKSGGG